MTKAELDIFQQSTVWTRIIKLDGTNFEISDWQVD